MFKGKIINYTSVANTNIPITTVFNTNNKILNNTTNNTIQLRKTGLYKLDGFLEVTGVVGDITATIYVDGVATINTPTVTLSAVTDYETIPLVDAFRVVSALYPNVADISIQLNLAGLTTNGAVIVEYVQ